VGKLRGTCPAIEVTIFASKFIVVIMATPNSRTSKKRSATSQVGPKSKKIHLHKPERPIVGDEPKKIRRGRPVTLPQNEHATSSEDEDVEDDEGSESLDEDTDMHVDDRPAKDPNSQFSSTLVSTSQFMPMVQL
jgi:hypothetical protein